MYFLCLHCRLHVLSGSCKWKCHWTLNRLLFITNCAIDVSASVKRAKLNISFSLFLYKYFLFQEILIKRKEEDTGIKLEVNEKILDSCNALMQVGLSLRSPFEFWCQICFSSKFFMKPQFKTRIYYCYFHQLYKIILFSHSISAISVCRLLFI